MEEEIKGKKVSVAVVLLIIALIVIAVMGIFIFKLSNDKKEIEEAYLHASEQIKKLNEKIDNSQETTDNVNEKITETYEKLKILSMENKTEIIDAIGGDPIKYNVITTVTKNHNFTSKPENNELYTNDMFGRLFVLYKDRLYYTNKKEIISKYCKTSQTNDGSIKLNCDYSKINDNTINEFNVINLAVNLKAVGSYGNAGSGSPVPYAITKDGRVIKISEYFYNNYYNGEALVDTFEIMYDDAEYPIDRIFNLSFYDGVEYTILLENGTLITRDVDREHPIKINPIEQD